MVGTNTQTIAKSNDWTVYPSPGFYNSDCVLLRPEESIKADALAVEAGISSVQLMETAGKSVATVVAQAVSAPSDLAGPVCVLCGPGNNGGDGFVAARYLEDWGFPVKLYLVGKVSDLSGDAHYMAERFEGTVNQATPDCVKGASIILDALFGAGLSRPVSGIYADLIEAVNHEEDALTIAIDLPSGLDGATGQALGSCVKADVTVTFFTRKPGHVLLPGRFLSGGSDHIHVMDIGIPTKTLTDIQAKTGENIPLAWQHLYPITSPFAHKYNKGHVLVLGGREPTLGASRLTSMAALRSGAGLVSLACPSESYSVQATALTDIMVRRFDSNFGFLGFLDDPRLNVVTIGPGAGVGEKTNELVLGVLKRDIPCVLDADGLLSFVGRSKKLKRKSKGDLKLVLTPHEGEFTRLFPEYPLSEGRLMAARSAAADMGAVVVLKGADTIIAHPDGRAYINSNAPTWLSVAGTGDVLAGMIAGLMAQGMPAFEASSAAVYFHSESAMTAGKGMIASDLLPIIARVLP
ncbi:NAD(P)H-hydrate dehydratase [Temperatibacter marinus]|uniref:Bifunctional NAD(P)H-hydrate repair enzyme n=1 Tax=Temperatibacter marinus TaxID=1456591 RepID=A0AA52HAB4_9PROT|nr:NAD(P)H-hydrate dehydratase [Temperatibacter marinus]WND02423.1 NAD(P)H-hydrate dehydratase [Temperatibacter marinus]